MAVATDQHAVFWTRVSFSRSSSLVSISHGPRVHLERLTFFATPRAEQASESSMVIGRRENYAAG